jgi:hypothetical protein
VLELTARAHRRPTALLASLAPSVARALTNCPASRPSPDFPEPPRPSPLSAVETRLRPPLHHHSGHLQLLGELLAEPGRSPGRQLRRFAGAGRARAAPLAKGWIATLQIFLGCFVLDSGHVCKELYLGFHTVQSSALENP